jgi:hypothetical protein
MNGGGFIMKRIIVLVMIMVLFVAAVSSAAYEVVDVKNGGGIKGKIKAAEKIADPVIKIVVKPKPDPKETELEKATAATARKRTCTSVSANEVKNVLAIVEDVRKASSPKTDLLIDNTKCYFEPIGIAQGANFKIKNSDPLLHNTNLGLCRRKPRGDPYNLALPNKTR